MGWIVLTVLAVILFWVGIGIWVYARKRDAVLEAEGRTSSDLMPSGLGLYAAIGVGICWVFMSFFFMVHTVGQREVAIVYNFSGTIAGKKDPGVVTTFPWQHVRKENVGIQHTEYDFGANNSAVSKDQQKIFAKLAVNYQIDSVNVVDLYERVGPSWKDIIIEARVPQVFKEVTATFPTPKITEERAELREQTRTRLIAELNQYDIKVVDVFITNLGFSDQYSQAIEEKQQQVQDAQRAEAKVKQVEAEARQKVAQAEGEAKSNVARARGDASANRLRQRSLTPRLIQWEAIQKLNPNVQIIVCPPQSVCIPNSAVVPNPGGN
jgi:regulator of protease activity HflC (stomatin/prohibitin superfamily)